VHLGVFLHEINGKREALSEGLDVAAHALLTKIASEDADFPLAARLLPLLLRHSSKKPFRRRRLLDVTTLALHPSRIARQLERNGERHAPGADAVAYGERHAQVGAVHGALGVGGVRRDPALESA